MRSLMICLLLGVFGASATSVDRPNIVWINCEDLDETLGCYGDDYAITPHLDALAKESILYRNAFANAPICAPARNCLITGMYPTSLGGQHLRCEIDLPPGVEPFPNHLRRAGYFVTNYAKTDYNFKPDGIYHYWKKDLAPWRARKAEDQPFFSFFVLGTTHEGPGNFRDRYESAVAGLSSDKLHDPAGAKVPPYFPDTPKMRELWARYYDLVSAMDE
jgi:N-sulfoglucosamine sulfohydrolase